MRDRAAHAPLVAVRVDARERSLRDERRDERAGDRRSPTTPPRLRAPRVLQENGGERDDDYSSEQFEVESVAAVTHPARAPKQAAREEDEREESCARVAPSEREASERDDEGD